MSIDKTVTYTAQPVDRLRRYYTLQDIIDFADALYHIDEDFDPGLTHVRLDGPLAVTVTAPVVES